MENIVLTKEQMQELKDLGIDISNAYFAYDSTEYLTDRLTACIGGEIFPTFTLQEIIELLPNIKGYYYPDLRQVSKLEWQVIYKPKLGELPWISKYGTTSIEAAFNMLKYCKQNNYI